MVAAREASSRSPKSSQSRRSMIGFSETKPAGHQQRRFVVPRSLFLSLSRVSTKRGGLVEWLARRHARCMLNDRVGNRPRPVLIVAVGVHEGTKRPAPGISIIEFWFTLPRAIRARGRSAVFPSSTCNSAAASAAEQQRPLPPPDRVYAAETPRALSARNFH